MEILDNYDLLNKLELLMKKATKVNCKRAENFIAKKAREKYQANKLHNFPSFKFSNNYQRHQRVSELTSNLTTKNPSPPLQGPPSTEPNPGGGFKLTAEKNLGCCSLKLCSYCGANKYFAATFPHSQRVP